MKRPARAAPHGALLAGVLALLSASPLHAQFVDCASPREVWRIESFASDYVVHEDGSIDVTERIDVDFGDLAKHGIYRDIDVEYRRLVAEDVPLPAGRVTFDLDVERVTDGAGEPLEVDVSREGNRKRIRIGSPSFCVSGRRTYVIEYTLSGGLGRFDEFDEFYWQVTGTGWPVPIGRAGATVTIPSRMARAYADSQPWAAHCYAGGPASTGSERCTARVVTPGAYRFSSGRLAPGEGLTVVATFPSGTIPGPTLAARTWDAILRFGPLAIPLVVFGLMLGVWRSRGRDPLTGSVVPQWRPPDLPPGAAGTLVDQKADMDDVVATILDLAVQGRIRIREVPSGILSAVGVDEDSFAGRALGALGAKQDWEFVLVDDEPGLQRFERLVLNGIFEDGLQIRRMSDLKEEFYEELPGIKDALYDELIERGYFARSPDTTRKIWMAVAAAAAVIGGMLAAVTLGDEYSLILVAVGLSAAVVFGFAFVMPAATRKGAEMRRYVKGLEEYVRRAEKAELEHKNAPERTPELFEALLPYAVALDVTDLWVDQFAGILTKPPDWYEGPMIDSGSGWNASSFSRDLSGFRSSAAATLASAPGGGSGSGSFGGGSVGGGGGGGGGGSW